MDLFLQERCLWKPRALHMRVVKKAALCQLEKGLESLCPFWGHTALYWQAVTLSQAVPVAQSIPWQCSLTGGTVAKLICGIFWPGHVLLISDASFRYPFLSQVSCSHCSLPSHQLSALPFSSWDLSPFTDANWHSASLHPPLPSVWYIAPHYLHLTLPRVTHPPAVAIFSCFP